MINSQNMMQLQNLLNWAAWCILEGKGHSFEGQRFASLEAIMQYAIIKTTNEGHPPISKEYSNETIEATGLIIMTIQYIRSGFPEVTLDTMREKVKQNWIKQNGLGHEAEFDLFWEQNKEEVVSDLASIGKQQQQEKLAILTTSIYFLDLLGTLELYHLGVELLEPLFSHINDLPVQQQVQLAIALAAIAREQVSSQKAYDYLISVKQDVPITDTASQANYHFSLANLLKDLGRYAEALRTYFLAETLALQSRPDMMGPLYSQIGRTYMEIGDYANADIFFNKAQNQSFETVENYEIYANISRAQSAYSQGNLPEAVSLLSELFSTINSSSPRYQAEYLIQALAGEISLIQYFLPVAEWHFTMAITAAELGTIKRELGALFGPAGLIVAQQLRGPEARYWLTKAKNIIQEHATYLNTASIYLQVAFVMYLLGMNDESVEFFQRSIIEAEKTGNIGGLVPSYTQLALATCLEDPEISQQATNKAIQVIEQNPDIPYPKTGHLLARELLLSSPDTLLTWPEFLRTSKKDDPVAQPILQRIIDEKVVNTPDMGLFSVLIPKRMSVCGTLYGYLAKHGFLDFLRRFIGLHARETVEWVLNGTTSPTLKQTIGTEWLNNPTSSNQTMRRGHKGNTKDLQHNLRQLRRHLVRYYFEQTLTKDKKTAQIYGDKYNSINVVTEKLRKFYRVHRQENYAGLELLELVEDPFETPIDLTSQDFLRKALSGQQVTASDYGIRLENHLDWEFFEPLSKKFANQQPPILLDLLQAKEKAFWIIVDLTQGYNRSSVSIHQAELSRSQAERIVKKIKTILRQQEKNQLGNIETARQQVYQLCEPLFTPILDYLASHESKYISAMAPWNAIPLEQLPVYPDSRCMIDFSSVLRRDRFGKSLNQPIPPPGSVSLKNIKIFGEPLNDTDKLNLPFAGQEAQIVANLCGTQAITGKTCNYERVVADMEQAQLLHLACHGHVFHEGYGDYVALLLADDFLLGQEIAALDLENCQLAVLSSCTSAVGQEYGISQMESLAEYLLEAGARAVVASQSQVSDQRTSMLMHNFYQSILSGQPISHAMSATFGIVQKRKHNVLIFPWILIGNDFSLVIEGNES